MSRRATVLVALCLTVSALQSAFFAWALVLDTEEEMYMYLGRLAVTGRIGLFQDDLVGNRMPLPYYLIGLSQLAAPGSIVAARLTSAALGLICFALVWRLATRLGGEAAGLLAVAFAVTQANLVGWFASVSYHSLVSLLLLGALYLELCTTLRARRVLAAALVGLLFFTRTTIMPAIPIALVYLALEAETWRERLAIAGIVVVPPLVFLLADQSHLKFLAFVPIVRTFAPRFGFETMPGNFAIFWAPEGLRDWLAAALSFARWYRMWILAALVLAVAAVFRGRRGVAWFAMPGVRTIAALTLYLIAAHVVVLGMWNPQVAVGYMQSFIVMAAICLGVWIATALAPLAKGSRARTLAIASLAVFFLVAPSQSRPPALPLAVAWDDTPVARVYRVANTLGELAPPNARVFQAGWPVGTYVAGLAPYVRLDRDIATLSPRPAGTAGHRSGLWDASDITEWLGRDAELAVVVPAMLQRYRGTALGPDLELIDILLRRHFVPIAVVEPATGTRCVVYRRQSRSTALAPKAPEPASGS